MDSYFFYYVTKPKKWRQSNTFELSFLTQREFLKYALIWISTLNNIHIILTSCYITIKTRKMSYVLCNPWFNSPFKWCDIPYFPSLVNRKITVFVLKKPEVLHSHLGHYPRHLSTSMSTNAFYFIVVPTNIVIWIFLSIYSALYHFLCSSFYLF